MYPIKWLGIPGGRINGRVSVSGKGAEKRRQVGECFENQPKDRGEMACGGTVVQVYIRDIMSPLTMICACCIR